MPLSDGGCTNAPSSAGVAVHAALAMGVQLPVSDCMLYFHGGEAPGLE